MPLLCCGSNNAAADPQEDPLDGTSKSERQRERKLAESVYHDARQSLTASMTYRPTISAIRRSVFSISNRPQELLKSYQPRSSVQVIQEDLQQPLSAQSLAGYPGELTQKEMEACIEFRAMVKATKDTEEPGPYEMLHIYDSFEQEAFAICRFMRARKFHPKDAFAMMRENDKKWKEGKDNDFFPDLTKTVGCPASVIYTQLPIVPHSIAANGSIVAYFQVGMVSLDRLHCISDLKNFVPFIWNLLVHGYIEQAAIAQKKYPDTTILGELTVIIDMKGMQRSLFTEEVMKTIKDVISVLNCFPEALSRATIINAPFFFSAIWMVLKQFIDARTTAKIDIYSNEQKGLACVREHIDKDELISDYGGNGISNKDIIDGLREEGTSRQLVEELFLEPHGTGLIEFELTASEKATVIILTRSVPGADFSVSKLSQTTHQVHVQPDDGGQSKQPYSKEIATELAGPGKFMVAAESSSSHKENFLVDVLVYAV